MTSQNEESIETLSDDQTSYDHTPYHDLSYVHTHPDRLATLGTLLGMRPAAVEGCQVLELGCAGGGNLLPMAYYLPNATFVGIDNSQRQIDAASNRAQRLGLSNIQFRSQAIRAVSKDLGIFDYIIAHGVYSWVPPDVRDALLNDPVYFHQFVEHAQRNGLQYLVEAELSTANPQYMGSDVAASLQELANDAIEIEQYMDFLRNRMFRQTLLSHEDAATTRRLHPANLVKCLVAANAVENETDSMTKKGLVIEFTCSDGAKLATDHPITQAAMRYLRQVWPQAVSFSDLLQQARRLVMQQFHGQVTASRDTDARILAANLFRSYGQSSQLVELHAYSLRLTAFVSEQPQVSSVARMEALSGALVTNAWHGRVKRTAFQRQLVKLCDGTRDMTALEAEILDSMNQGATGGNDDATAILDLASTSIASEVHTSLLSFARSALLIA